MSTAGWIDSAVTVTDSEVAPTSSVITSLKVCADPGAIRVTVIQPGCIVPQKSSRTFNVMVRLPPAVLITPKFAALMFVAGLPQTGVFKKRIASARNERFMPSRIRTILVKDMSAPRLPGPLIPGKFCAVFPVFPGCGTANMMLPELSTTT